MGCNCNEKKGFSLVEAATSIGSVVTSAVKTFTLKDYNPMTSPEVQAMRLNLCQECDYHTTVLNKSRCSICGCFLKAKTSLKDQSCPHPEGPKWQEEI
jgi:hypothetical protein